jgi:chorismate mutase
MARFLQREADMPQPQPIAPDPDLPAKLQALRGEIDQLDDSIHDLLMRRAAVVGEVAELGRLGKIPFRPGREAAIIRRLLAHHTGRLPRRTIVRLWREMFAGNISIEARFTIAACDTGPGDQLVALAREHFGPLTPLRVTRSAAQAIAEVSAGNATAAVLPMPVEEEGPHAAWWTALLQRDEPRIHVVAKLPFWGSPRPEGAPSAQALVVAAAAPDASGADRSLIGFELPADTSRARLSAALAAAAMTTSSILLRRDKSGGPGHGLIDVEGWFADDDSRLRELKGAIVLGSYALPIEGTAS